MVKRFQSGLKPAATWLS